LTTLVDGEDVTFSGAALTIEPVVELGAILINGTAEAD
jgi:hypothetical protein